MMLTACPSAVGPAAWRRCRRGTPEASPVSTPSMTSACIARNTHPQLATHLPFPTTCLGQDCLTHPCIKERGRLKLHSHYTVQALPL